MLRKQSSTSAVAAEAAAGRDRHQQQGITDVAAMGLTFTKLFARLFSKKEMRILMVSCPSRICLAAAAEQLLSRGPLRIGRRPDDDDGAPVGLAEPRLACLAAVEQQHSACEGACRKELPSPFVPVLMSSWAQTGSWAGQPLFDLLWDCVVLLRRFLDRCRQSGRELRVGTLCCDGSQPSGDL